MSDDGKVWMRSILYHTYWNIPREPDTFYQVDTEQDAETLVALKWALRDKPPAKARRPVAPPAAERTTALSALGVRTGAAAPLRLPTQTPDD